MSKSAKVHTTGRVISLRVLAGLAGFTALGLETALNVASGMDATLLAATVACPTLAALVLLAAEWAWHGGQKFRAAFVLLPGLVLTGVAIQNGLHRVAGAHDLVAASFTQATATRLNLETAREIQSTNAKVYRGLAEEERSKGGCGPNCDHYGQQAQEAEDAVAEIDTKLASLPPVADDSGDVQLLADLAGGR
jgi:hypothetical protein